MTAPHAALSHAAAANARELEADFEWLARVLQARLASYFATPSSSPPFDELLASAPAPALRGDSAWGSFVREHRLAARERALLLLALAPQVRPQLLDALLVRNETTQRGFAEFGGAQGPGGVFVPTLETACFLAAGDGLAERFALLRDFTRPAPWHAALLLYGEANEPLAALPLRVAPSYAARWTWGEEGREAAPGQGAALGARRIATGLAWRDLVLPHDALEQLEEVRDWIAHGRTLLDDWGLRHRVRPGHTALFHGPPGTGKTLAACLLGKLCARDVWRVDLSLVVSKYIGETEKNLARLFEAAEREGWILFFDEADALFGKRTAVADAHDRYANQEVSYLLQRIEDFEGVVILASNLRGNIDDAFVRRFQTVVAFPMPKAEERLRLWREAFSPKAPPDPALDLARLAERHEISGGTIMNVVRWASLKALARGELRVRAEDVREGVRRELLKEGRAF
jgi:hypothetical protein